MTAPLKHLQSLGVGLAGASVFTAAVLTAAPAVESASNYKLPYPAGASWYVTQGGGTGGHVGTQQHAIDWGMPIGSTLVAARGGRVKYVKEDSNVCGCSSAYGNSANYVVIDHGDNTQALYLHLQYNGALVSAGQRVEQGQAIAKSGMTGWTCGSAAGGCGPHLHFQVERPGIWFTQSLWVAFAEVLTNSGVVQTGHTYTSSNRIEEVSAAAATVTPPAITKAPFTATPTATTTAIVTSVPTVTTAAATATVSLPPKLIAPPARAAPAGRTSRSGGGGGGGGRSSPPPPTPTPASPNSSEETLDAATGGMLTVSGVQAQVPAGLAADGGQINVSLDLVNLDPSTTATSPSTELEQRAAPDPSYELSAIASSEKLLPPDGTVFGSRAFRLSVEDASGKEIAALPRPVQFRVPVMEQDVELAGGQTGAVRLYGWDATAARWSEVTGETDPVTRTVIASTDRTGLFTLAAVAPAPVLHGPRGGEVFVSLSATLEWQNAPGTRWYHVQLLPFNNDGPGLDMIVGDPAAVQRGRLEVPAPRLGVGNYLMLPGMSYAWRVRTSPASRPLDASDPAWGPWVTGGFRTAAPFSGTISLASPPSGASSATRTPQLEWRNSNDQIFYYEVQLSADPEFITDPNWAKASVYWELVHGGLTTPLNSYTVPEAYALQPATVYYWRVRPRVQGNGAGAAWSDAASFRTPDA